jgi:hypothetical protein
MIDKSPRRSEKLGRTYAIERMIPLCILEVSTTPFRELPRLVTGIAIPREAGTLVGGAAAVRKRSDARVKPREKYILRAMNRCLVGTHPLFGSDYEP